MVTKQATVMAYSDVFLITAGLAILGVFIALMLKEDKTNNEQTTDLASEKTLQIINSEPLFSETLSTKNTDLNTKAQFT